ncbi:discs large associated protein 2b isoform X2 [Denticeps clupeoides]|uniref:discs large associated protein 2b isoform X2 n=1 Tax=Denticeps clupeoides TaxID=299321 RepID=UPI0010A4DDE2|nr:disks large-associated protein 2-like isoform X2 [Denticeps clupeoides]
MKGLSGSRALRQIPSPHGYGQVEYERRHDMRGHRGLDSRHSTYLLSPTDSGYPMDFHMHCSPRSSIHSDCMAMSPGLGPSPSSVGIMASEHVSSSTFPRMHYSSPYYDSVNRDDCATIAASATSASAAIAPTSSLHHVGYKGNRMPSSLLDQFEKQLPRHRDGFHTLQYQRTSTTTTSTEQRSESPGRIRHLVHSVQKLFTKSHSLEGSSSKMNGTKGDGGGDGHHHQQSKHGSKRSKVKERKHRSGGWWSSDDNLDSDSMHRLHGVMTRPPQATHGYPLVHRHGEHSLRMSKSNNDVKCLACESMGLLPDGKMKRSSWSTLTVSQAKEAFRKSSLNLNKPSTLHADLKASRRSAHLLQVPHDEWGGYTGMEKEEEIPCRRMRSSSYVKAMGDDESMVSDTSPKTSPQKSIRPDALVLKSAIQRPHIDSHSQGYHLQTARDMRINPNVTLDLATHYNPPQFRSRNQSYMRAVSTLSQASCLSQGKNQSEKEKGRGKIKDCYSCFCLSGIQFRLPTSCAADRTQPSSSVVTYTPGYKKTPPPVPPRSVTKPIISVTAQSSTESAQDTYHEGQHPRGVLWAPDGRALYTSSESLDSARAVSLAMEMGAGKRPAFTGSHTSVQTCDKAVLVSKAEEYLKTPRSSVGIQVEALTDSDPDSRRFPLFHSVGIQVEDTKRQGRLRRSNSVTTAVQADLELEGFPSLEDKSLQYGAGFQRHSEPSTPTQYSALRTVRTQGLFSYREDYRVSSGPPSPQPEPWLGEAVQEETETGRVSPLHLDGNWFMQLLHNETKQLEEWCKEMELEAEEHNLTEDILGKIRSAVGSAQLLMSQKFQQFYWLCQQNLDPSAMPRPTTQDLAGFWDLLQLSIEDVSTKFEELQQIRGNDWRLVESPEKKDTKWPPPLPKRASKGRGAVIRERSLDLQDRQRQEARRRLMAAKRAASFRQSSTSERADSIEIYIPEAQTRL